jgi:hypothetical protein
MLTVTRRCMLGIWKAMLNIFESELESWSQDHFILFEKSPHESQPSSDLPCMTTLVMSGDYWGGC